MVVVPVALNVTGEPVKPVAVAVTVWEPEAEPKRQVVWASPLASVTALALPTEPPPAATAKLTTVPPTPTPSEAATLTTSGCGSCDPTAALWPAPDWTPIVRARSCTCTVTVSAGPVSSWATMRAVPRTARAVPAPATGAVIVAREGSSEVQKMGVFGIAAPFAPSAEAVNVKPSPSNTLNERGVIATRVAVAPVPA